MVCGVDNEGVQRGDLSRDEIWSGLLDNLGDELLAQLLRVSSSSLAGYARDTAPRAVEAR